MKIIGNIHSDIGNKKKVNQDAACLKVTETFIGNTLLAVVCDGMGGFSEGEVASSLVVRGFSNWFEQRFPELLKNGIDFDVLKREWSRLLEEQNEKLYQYGQNLQIKVGTTLTAFLLLGKKYFIVNVGDSRAYEMSDDIYQLTEDHTLVNQQVKEGKMTLEEANNHPKAHVLSQCVGVTDHVSPDFYEGIFNSRATYVLCTDGFRHKLTQKELYDGLHYGKINDLKSAKIQEYQLTELVKARGELDNITVLAFSTETTNCNDTSVTMVLYSQEDDLDIYVMNSDKKL